MEVGNPTFAINDQAIDAVMGPFKLQYKDKLQDKPAYDFIDNYNQQENKIEFSGFWLTKYR